MTFDALLAPHRAGLETRALGLLSHVHSLGAPNNAGAAGLQAMIRDQLGSGGKRLRGLLPAALVAAGGGPIEAALDLGACLELLHNGTLVHDDIQDNDRLRRGKPTLWTQVGVAQAINGGDGLLVGPLAALLEAPSIPEHLRAPLTSLAARALMATVRGQVADLDLRDDPAPSRATVEAVDIGKTGPLFGACLAGAALLLQLPIAQVRAAERLGADVGLAFQIRDDLLDLLGRKGRGDAGADLREGKPTWPVLLACEGAEPADVAGLQGLLARARQGEAPDDAEVRKWVEWLQLRGAEASTRARLTSALNEGRTAALQVFPPAPAQVVLALLDRLERLDE
jgi:geranylgeranyl pyrophosphate synthase